MKKIAIGTIAKFINGYAFKPTDWSETGTPIIRIQNLTDANKPFNRTKLSVPEKYVVRKGDTLVSWSATIDVFEWNNDENAFLNQHIFKVDFDHSKVDKEYFKHLLKYTIDDLTKFSHGSTMKHVVKGDFENHKIPLPDLTIQCQIAQLLSRAEALIATRQRSLALLDDFLKSTFLDLFHNNPEKEEWPLQKIEALAKKEPNSMRTGPFGSDLLHSEFVNVGVYVLGIDNVTSNKFEYAGSRYITDEKYEKLRRYKVKPGDVLVSIMGTVGRTAVVPQDIPEAINTKHLAAITLDQNLARPEFLSFSIHSDPFVLSQINLKGRGAIMTGLNLGIIKNARIRRPPLSLQTQFATIVNRVEALKTQQRESLRQLQNLYQSLLQRAFTGELNVSNVTLPQPDMALTEAIRLPRQPNIRRSGSQRKEQKVKLQTAARRGRSVDDLELEMVKSLFATEIDIHGELPFGSDKTNSTPYAYKLIRENAVSFEELQKRIHQAVFRNKYERPQRSNTYEAADRGIQFTYEEFRNILVKYLTTGQLTQEFDNEFNRAVDAQPQGRIKIKLIATD